MTTRIARRIARCGHGRSAATTVDAARPATIGVIGPRASDSAADDDVVDRFERGRAEEHRADRNRPVAERGEPKRREHATAFRRGGREGRRTMRDEHPRVAERTDQRRDALLLERPLARSRAAPTRRARTTRSPRLRTSGPCRPATPRRRAPGRTARRRRRRRTPGRSCGRAARRGARATSQAERAGPRERAREALHEAREVELPCLGRRGRRARVQIRDERQPDERPCASRRRGAATMPLGIAPMNAPAGYAAASTPAPVFPSAELVGVVREQRRERGEEERVEEHDRARQQSRRTLRVTHGAGLLAPLPFRLA